MRVWQRPPAPRGRCVVGASSGTSGCKVGTSGCVWCVVIVLGVARCDRRRRVRRVCMWFMVRRVRVIADGGVFAGGAW